MKKYIAFVILVLIGIPGFSQAKKQKTILVIVAHPDDETGFGAVLSKHARLGDRVYIAYATGAKNDSRFSATAPDSLEKFKQAEIKCSCEKLGIMPPVFLSFTSMDRKYGEKDGVRAAVETGNRFKEKIKDLFMQLQPDLVISFGPEGEYGHPEHIIAGSLVTELLLREGWVEKYPLYYFGWTKTQEADGDGWVRYADDQYFNVAVHYTQEDEQKAMESIKCYPTGFSQKDITEMIGFESKRENVLYFRKFVVEKGLKREF